MTDWTMAFLVRTVYPKKLTSPSKPAKVQQNLSYPTPVESVLLVVICYFLFSFVRFSLFFCTN